MTLHSEATIDAGDFTVKEERPFERCAGLDLRKTWFLSTSEEAKKIRDTIVGKIELVDELVKLFGENDLDMANVGYAVQQKLTELDLFED